MKANNIHIVVNPTAGSGKAKKDAYEIGQRIKAIYGTDVTMTFTKGKDDATFITREAITEGSQIIIAVGGDGTINEVANGFFNEGIPLNPDCELGIINCGTGRGFANSLNLPKTIREQVRIIEQQGSSSIDLGSLTFKNFSGEVSNRLFINECQAGIGSKVASLVIGKIQKAFGGTLAFGLTASIEALRFKPISLNIKFDEEQEQEFKLIGLVIGNGTECAGGMKLTPGAKVDDALFDVLLMHDMNIVTRLFNLSKTYSGTHVLSPYFSIKRCRKLKISSETDCQVEADGEMLGYTPLSIEILPAVLKVKTGFKNPR